MMLYRIATGGEIDAPLGTYGTRLLLIPSADKNVYAVDLFTANVNWTFSSGAPVLQEPLVADNDVYVVNKAGILGSLDVRIPARRPLDDADPRRPLARDQRDANLPEVARR